MRGIISFLLIIISLNARADDHEIWMHLNTINHAIGELQAQVKALENKGDIKSLESPLRIGDEYQGGIVFWVDSEGRHGLIASKFDLNNGEGAQWQNGESGNKVTNARADGIYAGELNTRLIIAEQTEDNQAGIFAALIAANFSVSADGETPCILPINPKFLCYSGWYLPSRYELSLLKTNLYNQGLASLSPEFYWSSTEASVSLAWLQNFGTGEFEKSDKAGLVGKVRAIRGF